MNFNEAKQKAQDAYAWDMVFSNGERIKDKYDDLIDRVSLVVTITKNNDNPSYIICSKTVSSCYMILDDSVFEFITSKEFDLTRNDNVMRIGRIKGYDVFVDKEAPDDEILVVAGGKVASLKIYNGIF